MSMDRERGSRIDTKPNRKGSPTAGNRNVRPSTDATASTGQSLDTPQGRSETRDMSRHETFTGPATPIGAHHALPDPVLALALAARAAHERFNQVCHNTDVAGIEQETNRGWKAARKAEINARRKAYSACPTTATGLCAMLDVFETLELEHVNRPADELLRILFSSVRRFVGGMDVAATPDPVFAAIQAVDQARHRLEERRRELQAEDVEELEAERREEAEFDLLTQRVGDAYRTKPTTPAGYLALADLFIEEDSLFLNPDNPDDAELAAFNLIRWGCDLIACRA